MNEILQMAIKDLRLLFRDRLGAFFIIGFPILMGLFFGLILSPGSGGGRGAMKIAIVDQDQSEMSARFIESLRGNESIELETMELEPARESVRRGNRIGMVVLPPGFGESAGIFWQEQPPISLGMDPSRTAESGMMQGFLMEAIGDLAGDRFQNPKQFRPFVQRSQQDVLEAADLDPTSRQLLGTFFGSLDAMFDSLEAVQSDESAADSAGGPGTFQFANIEAIDITREVDPQSQAGQLRKLTSRWDISFPQAMMWGVLACVAGFSISVARERTLGTMLRLQVAPISKLQILAGKALACFLAVAGVIAMLTLLGISLGMQPGSYPRLALATFSVAFCFVGIMMAFSVLGKTEQSVSGIGWAINMVMAMLGGAMIPVMFMPEFLQRLSVLSPIRWGILAIEGAIWRQFSWAEMAFPCAILCGVGIIGLVIGTALLNRD